MRIDTPQLDDSLTRLFLFFSTHDWIPGKLVTYDTPVQVTICTRFQSVPLRKYVVHTNVCMYFQSAYFLVSCQPPRAHRMHLAPLISHPPCPATRDPRTANDHETNFCKTQSTIIDNTYYQYVEARKGPQYLFLLTLKAKSTISFSATK